MVVCFVAAVVFCDVLRVRCLSFHRTFFAFVFCFVFFCCFQNSIIHIIPFHTHTQQGLRSLSHNHQYWLLVYAFGVGVAVVNAMLTLIGQIANGQGFDDVSFFFFFFVEAASFVYLSLPLSLSLSLSLFLSLSLSLSLSRSQTHKNTLSL